MDRGKQSEEENNTVSASQSKIPKWLKKASSEARRANITINSAC